MVNSRFISSAAPAFSVQEARGFIKKIETKYPDASHHVPLFIIGHGNSTTKHCSDNGEPSGTAGRPALAVLEGSGIGDVVVVVTRYYGGTNLGTGGLVRAYSDSVREVLNALPLARKIITTTLMFVIGYPHFEQVERLIDSFKGQVIDRDFAADVTLSVQFPNQIIDQFKQQMVSLTQGQIEFIVIEKDRDTIMPL